MQQLAVLQLHSEKFSLTHSCQNPPHNKMLFARVHSFAAKMTNDEPLNRRAKSQEVLRQTGFETTFTGRGRRSQSRGNNAKPRIERGPWQIESLQSRFEL